MLAPGLFRGKRHPGVDHLAAFLVAQLLSQLYRACRTGLHTFAAGYAVGLFYLRHISGAGHIRRVEQLGGAQRVADIYIAVADGKNLVRAVNIGNLVYEAVVLRRL